MILNDKSIIYESNASYWKLSKNTDLFQKYRNLGAARIFVCDFSITSSIWENYQLKRIEVRKRTFWHITVFFRYTKSKNMEKSASGGQCLTDRQFQRYVSCRLNTCEHFHTKFFLTPRGLIGQICDLRKANFSIFKWLCLPDRTEFDRFSGMYEFV